MMMMKAVVSFSPDGLPQYVEDFPEPLVRTPNEILITMKAAAIKHLDRSRAGGQHYSTRAASFEPRVIGGDGVGILPDGTRVFALGVSGMIAEKAIVEKGRVIPLPDGIDDATAAALPNAIAGSAMALRFRALMQPGETVLINGATGFTGKIAIQLAKQYGASRVIATGRNRESLELLKALGADEVLHISDEEQFISRCIKIHQHTPVNIVLDYLWGSPAEWILTALRGVGNYTQRTRFISIGSMAGQTIQLSSEILRSTDLHLSGSGLGSWTKQEMQQLFKDIIPGVLQLAVDKKIQADTQSIPLHNIGQVWKNDLPSGIRRVIII